MRPCPPPTPQVRETSRASPSPAPETPWYTSTSIPSMPARVMTLTTPPTASDPYTAEAPSLRTSTRSMTEAGMELRSAEALAPVPPGT